MPSGAPAATVSAMTTTAPSPLAPGLRAAGFVGRVGDPAAPDYDRARAGWNGAVDRRPAAVAYAGDPDDVPAAIRAARAPRTPFTIPRAARPPRMSFTIRTGAHSLAGRSVRDGALCIDLRGLNAVAVDPEHAIV